MKSSSKRSFLELEIYTSNISGGYIAKENQNKKQFANMN